jgi:hypothetical protein
MIFNLSNNAGGQIDIPISLPSDGVVELKNTTSTALRITSISTSSDYKTSLISSNDCQVGTVIEPQNVCVIKFELKNITPNLLTNMVGTWLSGCVIREDYGQVHVSREVIAIVSDLIGADKAKMTLQFKDYEGNTTCSASGLVLDATLTTEITALPDTEMITGIPGFPKSGVAKKFNVKPLDLTANVGGGAALLGAAGAAGIFGGVPGVTVDFWYTIEGNIFYGVDWWRQYGNVDVFKNQTMIKQ